MEKNFIISDVAEGTVEPVNMLNIFTFRKSNPGPVTGTGYGIQFYKDASQLDSRPITWKYDTAEKRDCDYAKIVALVAQSINEVV